MIKHFKAIVEPGDAADAEIPVAEDTHDRGHGVVHIETIEKN